MSEDSLLEFPCQFPIKAMGKNEKALEIIVINIVKRHAPQMHEHALKAKTSKNGQYLALTITVEVHSKQQLDAIYQELTAHPLVLYAL